MEKYVLGVDGGGTKTVARITDTRGDILSEVQGDSGNYKSVGISKASGNLYRVVGEAAKEARLELELKFASACFGLSGLDSPKDEKIYRKIIFKPPLLDYLDRENTIICNDSRIGLYAGSESPNAIMIICGTGSNCFGKNSEGLEAKANGWDYLLGDEGSGFSIAARALKAVMRDFDGRGEDTLLSDIILKELGLEDIYGLIEWAYGKPLDTGRVASLARVVCRTAARGDRVSRGILADEAREAELSVSTVAKKLGFGSQKFDLVFVGSVFKCEKYFKNILEKNLKEKFPNINFIPFTQKPVSGAIKLALMEISLK
ncbi:MAG: N-acetylglucosamine kinase [Actinomycetota bacterium]